MSVPDLYFLQENDVLGAIDVHLARTLARLVPQTSPLVLLATALASRAVQQGHVCADLRRVAGTSLLIAESREGAGESLPPIDVWLKQLVASPLVASTVDERDPRPLVLDENGRLYLYRYARYQKRLACHLNVRATIFEEVDMPLLADGLSRLFPAQGPDEQKRAAAVAALRSFSVISGGPGTGKTFTVARILALLAEQSIKQRGCALRVKAMAPTGKAAQRLMESLSKAANELDVSDDVRQSIVTPTSTIHRSLGFDPVTPTRFRHNQDNPLPTDVVVVDEASMVDLALMSKLVESVPAGAKLILLGDKDQLASVEAGSILADIYGDGSSTISREMSSRLNALGLNSSSSDRAAGIDDGCIHLSRSRRYAEESGIAAVARAVNAGDAAGALAMAGQSNDVRLFPATGSSLPTSLEKMVISSFARLTKEDATERLAILSRFKILCAHRRGPGGAELVNLLVQKLLATHNIICPEKLWYDGRPILITANDPVLDLYNGDVGVICVDQETQVPLAHFASVKGPAGTRSYAPARLPSHETVFAMTVHKSQGSEFDHVALLMPDAGSQVLTRELIYTAITRAKKAVDLYSAPDVFAAAVMRLIERSSGLKDELHPAALP
jgi:exodeoxyribonuclease V alpha subunit